MNSSKMHLCSALFRTNALAVRHCRPSGVLAKGSGLTRRCSPCKLLAATLPPRTWADSIPQPGSDNPLSRFLPDVIHTVGPIAQGEPSPSQEAELSNCYKNSLRLALENKLRSVVSQTGRGLRSRWGPRNCLGT